jgi:hypothetical protein
MAWCKARMKLAYSALIDIGSFPLRLIRIELPTGETEVLLTSLNDTTGYPFVGHEIRHPACCRPAPLRPWQPCGKLSQLCFSSPTNRSGRGAGILTNQNVKMNSTPAIKKSAKVYDIGSDRGSITRATIPLTKYQLIP